MTEPESHTNYLATVSDLMAGLIFVFIVTMMVFVIRFQAAATSIESARTTRAKLLNTLQEELKKSSLLVLIDENEGVLRLDENSINFPLGGADPVEEHRANVDTLASVMSRVLPCFVESAKERCGLDPAPDAVRFAGSVGSLMIEGHTDSLPIRTPRFRNNLELSGARASSVYHLLLQAAPDLAALANHDDLPVLGIAGYGETRLLSEGEPFAAANRRIELRFLMEPPSGESVEPEVVQQLESEVGAPG